MLPYEGYSRKKLDESIHISTPVSFEKLLHMLKNVGCM
jgi:hypothetical protein